MDEVQSNSSQSKDILRSDPSWNRAFQFAEARLQVPQNVSNLFRAGWRNQLSVDDFIRQAGFCHLCFDSLVESLPDDELRREKDRVLRFKGILESYGLRYACSILAINYLCKRILDAKPPAIWKSLFSEMMTAVHIGSIIGERVGEVGVESGMLMGFARAAGLSILMSFDAATFRKWYSLSQGYENKNLMMDTFGCEAYQVSSATLQIMGFGPGMAIGAGLAMGNLNISKIDLGEDEQVWRSCFLWIEALREGRSYPAPIDARNHFLELVPPKNKGQRNIVLEQVYTEVAKLKRTGSPWQWHLTGIKLPD